MSDRPLGPLGIDPLAFSATLFGLLLLFVLYLLLPRGVRVQYFGAYPKRYAWSARTRGRGRKKGDMVRLSLISLASLQFIHQLFSSPAPSCASSPSTEAAPSDPPTPHPDQTPNAHPEPPPSPPETTPLTPTPWILIKKTLSSRQPCNNSAIRAY
jgi:hypothetical protein